jgi:putative membrane-bound dehydrogenase-like protein
MEPVIVTMFARVVALILVAAVAHAAEPPLKVLFLGDQGPHRPADRFAQVAGRDPSIAAPYADKPVMTKHAPGLRPFEYEPAKVPLYAPGGTRKGDDHVATMQKALLPDESRKHALTPDGFRIAIHASEPLLKGKPLAMCFDADGTLFVSESVDYPNDLVEPKADDPAAPVDGRDRIVRLSDTDGDGIADRRDVFAEKLSIPTSMLHHDGGLIVAQAPLMLFLKDTDGDGKADARSVLFSGWGTGDTHAGPSNLTWGLDGWVYGIVGYSGFSGTVSGESLRFGAGFFRFKPDGTKLEFLRSTNNNSWGFGFSEEGLVFGSTANGNPSEHMPLPNRLYERVHGWSATTLGGIAGSPAMELAPRAADPAKTVAIRQVDHHGNFTAAAGHRLYTARAYPQNYWNRTAFVCEPTGHIVATFELSPKGAGFTSRMAWNLIASDDEWTAPIQADVGPDGQVWVIDWYNFIVQHNPTPAGFETGKRGAYITPLRDKVHGRIWRVVHGDAADVAPRNLSSASPTELVAMLRDTNMFWRDRAQRVLIDRALGRSDGGRDLVPLLIPLVQDFTVDAVGLNAAAIHALWTLEQLGALDGDTAEPLAVATACSALLHPSAGVRMNAVKVLPRDEALLGKLADSGVCHDPSPLVRLAVLEALSEWRTSETASRLVLELLADPKTLADPILADAATAAAAVHAKDILATLLTAADEPSLARLAIVARVSEHVARGGDAELVAASLVRLKDAPASLASAAITGFARGWPKGRKASFGGATDAAIATLVSKLPADGQGQLVALVQATGSTALNERIGAVAAALLKTLDDETASEEQRAVAAERYILLKVNDPEAVKVLLARVNGRMSPELAASMFAALGRSEAPITVHKILDVLPGLTPHVRQAAVRTVLGKRDWAMELIKRLDAGMVKVSDVPVVERVKLTEHPDRKVRDRARRILASGGGLPSPDRQRVIDDVLPVVMAGGDAARGKAVFKEHCGKCHIHSGEGGKVGPDLTGMAVHPAHELLIHILDPNRSVEGNYRSYTVTTDEGRVVTGLLVAESKTAIEVVDAEGQRHAIQRDGIDELVASPNSLMPVGFEKQIPPAGFADLLAFLTARGKFVPLPLDKVATAVSTKGMFYDQDDVVERLVFPDWGPKQFKGVPFSLIDPRGQSVPNVVMLHGPNGYLPPTMPKTVLLPVGSQVRAIHILGGIGGWSFPASERGTTSMVVRLAYDDGKTEDHPLVNGIHLADYIRRMDVPESEFAFDLEGRQLRYLRVQPQRPEPLATIELVKGPDATAPVVMAVTLEMP